MEAKQDHHHHKSMKWLQQNNRWWQLTFGVFPGSVQIIHHIWAANWKNFQKNKNISDSLNEEADKI